MPAVLGTGDRSSKTEMVSAFAHGLVNSLFRWPFGCPPLFITGSFVCDTGGHLHHHLSMISGETFMAAIFEAPIEEALWNVSSFSLGQRTGLWTVCTGVGAQRVS